jgi:histone deacetylase 11
MEAFISFMAWLIGLALIPISFTVALDYWYLTLILAIILLVFWPVIWELLMLTVVKIQKSSGALEKDLNRISRKITTRDPLQGSPIVYNSAYNITAFGLEKMHPFDSKKYGRIYHYLLEWGIMDENKIFMKPGVCPKMYLYEQCTFWHILFMNYSIYISKCVELPICFVPAWMIKWRALNPMLRATYGTIQASFMAMERGIAINLSGGYHHAHGKSGGGFCCYPDITIAIKMVRKMYSLQKVMIIDLDAHQGNGHERDFLGDIDCYIFDCFRPDIYPGDRYATKAIDKQVHVYPGDNDQEYINKISCIPECIDEFKPEFILYNAGTDIMKGDPLSGLNITEDGVIERDELVLNAAFDRNIP